MLIVASALTAAAVGLVVVLIVVYRTRDIHGLAYINRAEAARLREARRASPRTAV